MKAEVVFENEMDAFFFRRSINRAFKIRNYRQVSQEKNSDGDLKITCTFDFEPFQSNGGPGKKLNKKEMEKFKNDFDSGMSKRALMKKYSISYSTVNNYLRFLNRM